MCRLKLANDANLRRQIGHLKWRSKDDMAISLPNELTSPLPGLELVGQAVEPFLKTGAVGPEPGCRRDSDVEAAEPEGVRLAW